MNKNYLLKEILKRVASDTLIESDRDYLSLVQQGPGVKDIDIEWMTDGEGYYTHLNILRSLPESERGDYLVELKRDAEAWLAIYPEHYPIQEVCDEATLFLEQSPVSD